MSSSDHLTSWTLSIAVHALGMSLIGCQVLHNVVDDQVKPPTLEFSLVELSLIDAKQETPGAVPSAISTPLVKPVTPPPPASVIEPEPIKPLTMPEPKPISKPLPVAPPAITMLKSEFPMPTVPDHADMLATATPPVITIASETTAKKVQPTPASVILTSGGGASGSIDAYKNGQPTPASVILTSGGGASGRIDAYPSLERAIRPVYPLRSRRRGEEGTVILDVAVNTNGSVSHVTLVTSSGFTDIDHAAEHATSQAHFKPGTRNGQPTQSAARLTVIFRLRDP